MRTFSRIALCGLLTAASIFPAAARASTILAVYDTITSQNPDVATGPNGVVKGLVKSTLGPDGLPVEATPGTFHDVNAAGELLWWTPHAVNGTTYVTAGTSHAYPSIVALPFSITSNFYPDGPTGGNGGSTGFVSAVLSGAFDTPAGGSVTFTLGSDDDAWVFLNGHLVVDNGGIHAYSPAPTTVTGLAPGVNTVEVFFADRERVQSGLSFNANVTVTPAVPEPSTWALTLVGVAGLGFAGRRASRAKAAAL